MADCIPGCDKPTSHEVIQRLGTATVSLLRCEKHANEHADVMRGQDGVAVEIKPNPYDTPLTLTRRRVEMKVYVDLDPVPGTFHDEDDARYCVQRILLDAIPHYHPVVHPGHKVYNITTTV